MLLINLENYTYQLKLDFVVFDFKLVIIQLTMKKIILSKSKIMRGFQCHKNLWLATYKRELEPPVSAEQQAVFDQGHLVGSYAQKQFAGGQLVDNKPWDFFGAVKKTKDLIKSGASLIYEAAFEYNNTFARADIIKYNPITERWQIFEVKSSTSVKEEQLQDVGIQAWIMAKSGLAIERINIMHINNQCAFPNLENLFTTVDVTEEIAKLSPLIETEIENLFLMLKSDIVPDIDIGTHCDTPYECPFKTYCYSEKKIPEVSVLNLPKIGARKWDLYREGILKLDDPRLSELTPAQQRAVDVFKTKKRFVDATGIKKALSSWKFPMVFLDFETINPAIPRYDGTSPYQQVPFQFSAHIWPSPESELIHKEYLHTDASDPRPKLIPLLLEACKGLGSIVAYYSIFETQRISEMAEYSKKHRAELEALLDRFVDPLPIFREFVYDNNFEGSFSLKTVAPSILGEEQSYEGMMVADGSAAQRAFEEIINPKTDTIRREELISASLEYCKKDTMVMVELVKWLKGQI